MPVIIKRLYNCKDEELPVISGFVLFSIKRDLLDFIIAFPRFKDPFVALMEKRIADLSEMAFPQSETEEIKNINAHVHQVMSQLSDAANYMSGYIEFMKDSVVISEAGFGITALRSGIARKDPEKVLSAVHTINKNIKKYKDALTEAGLRAELSALFMDAETSIRDGKQKAYAISRRRAAMVQANLTQFNDLFLILKDIFKAGKILYKKKNPVKFKEYTFTHLRKGVRRVPLTASQLEARVKAAEKKALKAAKPKE